VGVKKHEYLTSALDEVRCHVLTSSLIQVVSAGWNLDRRSGLGGEEKSPYSWRDSNAH